MGDFYYHLIRPISPLFFLSLKEFSANSFLNLLLAIGILAYSLGHYSQSFTAADVLLLLGLILNGTLIYYCCQMLMILPVFWTQSAKGFMDLFYSMGIAMERPDRIFKGWLRIVFTIFLPFALIASFPVRLFLEKFHWPTFFHLAAVSLGLWILMLFIWKKGLKVYSSASS
jgi:ABC-2 type transport system permease protein